MVGLEHRKFVLLDTSAILGYYVPEAATNNKAAERIQVLIDGIRHHHADVQLLIPNIVVAEVFCQLARLCYSSWDKRVAKKFPGTKKTLDTRRYKSARAKFRQDIHNGALMYQQDVSRYHILALDLIAPVDKHRKFYRTKTTNSMGASDLLIGAMAMHLSRIHGKSHVVLVSNDRRMDAIFATAGPTLNANTAKRLGIIARCKDLGFGSWSEGIYPQVLDFARCKNKDLEQFFGEWPMDTRKTRNLAPKA